MSKFTEWIKTSFEGGGKTASSRRVTTFWFVVLETIISFTILVTCMFLVFSEKTRPHGLDAVWKLIIFSIISRVSIFLLMSIITWQNITDTVNAVKGGNFTSITTKETKETSKQVGSSDKEQEEQQEEQQEGS